MESGSNRGGDATVAELMEAWLDFAADKVALNTLQGYRSKSRHRIVPKLGKVPLRVLAGLDSVARYRQPR